jgi:hypothetical protein
MTRQDDMTLQEALYETIHKSKKPLKLIAEEIDMSQSYLTRSCLPTKDDLDTGTGCNFPLRKLIPLTKATNKYLILDVLEHGVGRCGIILTPPGKLSISDICKLAMHSAKEFGELAGEVEAAIFDEEVTAEECKKITREGYHTIQAILSLMMSCKDSVK